jgi:hypothetical protein
VLRSFHDVPAGHPATNDEGVGFMLTVALSILFGFVAFAALAQIHLAIGQGLRRGRLILAELSHAERAAVRAKSARRPGRRQWQPELAAA